MSWVCSNCSNPNEEADTCCAVCGYDRPVSSTSDTIEGKIVFSDFAVVTESFKNSFNSIKNIGKRIKTASKKRALKRAERLAREAEAATPVPREERRAKPPKAPKPKKVKFKKSFEKPWPEHNVKLDIEAIKNKGFVKLEKTEMNSVKGYTLYKEDGTSQFIRAEMLVILHMATRK